jgi:protein involved in polysaccharide export with SLBB domain
VLKRFPLYLGTAVFLCGVVLSNGADSAYRLFARDVITLGVYGEPDMTTELRIAGNGMINVPLLGNVHVVGLNLTAAERKIEEAYIEQQIFIRPQITLQVKEYSKKEVSILGQIGKQGKVELPPESVEMNIVNAVSLAGGFTRIAKADSVSVTRTNPETGEESVFTVNVEQMIAGRSKESVFYVIPGDIVFVPERLF